MDDALRDELRRKIIIANDEGVLPEGWDQFLPYGGGPLVFLPDDLSLNHEQFCILGVVLSELWQPSISDTQARFDSLFPPPTRRTRIRWWLQDHRPHFHLGPCDHGDCEPW